MVKFLVFTFVIAYGAMLEAATNGIQIPAGNRLLLTLHAKGYQIFKCRVVGGDYGWQWQAPEADLYDQVQQVKVGNHGAGPTWSYQDGSSVKGQIIQKIESRDPGAAPWLLIEAKEAVGKGVLAATRFILRFNTQGGLPPKTGCNADSDGTQAKVAYLADYSFYGR